MNIKKTILPITLLISAAIFAQNDANTAITPRLSVLDSLKKTFVSHNEMSCMDSLWVKELTNQELSSLQFEDIKNINPDEAVVYDLSTEVFKERLKRLDDKSPFNIEYNAGLENIVKNLLKNRKKSYERLMAMSEYYFPLFEDALAKYNIPIEIKYLAIVESALNPKAKSRVGATGLWQFMYGTGLQYNLDVNSYIDERSDPIKATEAACKYLSGMYTIFGDWDLVLASYNCGPGNVTKAIRRSGGQKNYWNIRKNLPQETAGYLPAFLATMYIFEYHKEHGIVPQKAPVNYFATDTIVLKKQLTFNQISKLIDVPVAELEFLNPSYKLNVIPYQAKNPNYLRLPLEKIAMFTSNEDKIYYYANYEDGLREKPNQRLAVIKDTLNKNSNNQTVTRFKYHKVRKGDNIGDIASKYGVSEDDIKNWNNLKNSKIPLGRNLKILASEKTLSNDIAIAKAENVNEKQISNKDASSISENETVSYKDEKLITYKQVTKFYKVKKGDSMSEIANKYGVTTSEIKKWNKLKSNTVAKGKSLKIISNEKIVSTIRKKDKKSTVEKQEPIAVNENINNIEKGEKPTNETEIFKNEKVISYQDVTNSYKVKKGDNLGEIADKFNVTTSEIKKWNKLKNNNVALGKTLKIITNEKVVTTVKKRIKKENIEKPEIVSIDAKSKKLQKTETTSKSAATYIVQSGDNLSSIAKDHKISVNELKKLNNFEDDNVMVGTKLVVSKPELEGKKEITKKEQKNIAENKAKQNMYLVQKGDSLFSISRKYQITVSDLKKWNDIQDGNIKPGMKLKISG